MSVDVLREVFRLSQSRGVARNVLTVLADAAHPDGVTWLPIEKSKDGDPHKCITHRANASKRAVIDALATLQADGELEVRQAQRGRARINVYRVVLGSVGAVRVDYSDMPFALEHPFSDGVQNLHVVRNEENDGAGCSSRDDGVQISSRRGADLVSDECLETEALAGDSSVSPLPEASREPSLQPSAADQDLEVPAAAEAQVTDGEIADFVRSLRGADPDSPRRIIPLAYGLPRATFAETVEIVRSRNASNPCGLLTHLLKIARAERTLMLSAQLQASLGTTARIHVTAPWAIDVVRSEEPERYVRLMAKTLADADLREALCAHGDRVDELLELADRVRAGDEEVPERDTPEQARARWVDRHAETDPAAEVAVVIDAWDDVDPIERQTLHERAEQIRDAKRKAA